jgi:hypothetical protein
VLIERLNKIFARWFYFKLIGLSLVVQLFSLFRSYPTSHPCGRVVNLNQWMSVLINCDSAVYMKDAQSANRLFDGESVYQDRPFPTLIISVFTKVWHFIKLPDFYYDVIGNSGKITSYSLITYLSFLMLNALLLSLTCWYGINALAFLSNKYNIITEKFVLLAFMFTLLISMNEISKTFFWTPGSQMFNLLIPIYIFYLLQFANNVVTTRFFLTNLTILTFLIFSYAFSVLATIPLMLVKYKSTKLRLTAALIPLFFYIAYPQILQLIGGTYNNFGLGYRRLFLWVLDSYYDQLLIQSVGKNLLLFTKTFPVLPIILISAIFLLITNGRNNLWDSLKIIKFEIIVLFLYSLTFSFYGYYSRRLTYPLIIFAFMAVMKIYAFNSDRISHKKNILMILLVVPFLIYSWVFTNGPLI